ncbi:MAG: hypothetical protein V9H69_10580 [Anaerolineae bacterium]
MSLARMTDSDLRKIVEAAINAQVTGTDPSPETIASIADGDEDIPILIANMAKLRWLFWTTPEQGIAFLAYRARARPGRRRVSAKTSARPWSANPPSG